MKTIFTLLFIACCLGVLAQNNRFQLQGQILTPDGDPIGDVYIVNPRNQEKDVSKPNGVFTVNVLPGDSLVLSHISYSRKLVTVQTILMNPRIIMNSENIDIEEVTVSPEQMTDQDRAMKNLSFLKEYKAASFTKIKEETSPTKAIMTEHNREMRVEAGSVSLLRLSPSGSLSKRKKRKSTSTDYYSTRKQKKTEEDEEEE